MAEPWTDLDWQRVVREGDRMKAENEMPLSASIPKTYMHAQRVLPEEKHRQTNWFYQKATQEKFAFYEQSARDSYAISVGLRSEQKALPAVLDVRDLLQKAVQAMLPELAQSIAGILREQIRNDLAALVGEPCNPPTARASPAVLTLAVPPVKARDYLPLVHVVGGTAAVLQVVHSRNKNLPLRTRHVEWDQGGSITPSDADYAIVCTNNVAHTTVAAYKSVLGDGQLFYVRNSLSSITSALLEIADKHRVINQSEQA